jgi:hypothetical protein
MAMTFIMTCIVRVDWRWRWLARNRTAVFRLSGFLNYFIEFAAVQPDPATGGAIVNFNSLAFGHHQVGFFAYGAFHKITIPFIAKVEAFSYPEIIACEDNCRIVPPWFRGISGSPNVL